MEQSTDKALVTEAAELADKMHAGQLDRDGQPHIVHVARVAAAVPEYLKPIAWLHDVVEDTHMHIAGIDVQFGHIVGGAVELLTRKDGETYEHYLMRLVGQEADNVSRAAWKVKRADLADNLTRSLASGDVAAVSQYAKAWCLVTNRIMEESC